MPRPGKVILSPYFPVEDADQVRAAHAAVGGVEGYASISELIVVATMKEVRRLQRKHNGGKEWEPLPAGTARPGRRTRNERRVSEERGG